MYLAVIPPSQSKRQTDRYKRQDSCISHRHLRSETFCISGVRRGSQHDYNPLLVPEALLALNPRVIQGSSQFFASAVRTHPSLELLR